MKLAIEIRTAREAVGLSQEDLARLASVAVATVSKIERGACDPRASTVERIRLALSRAGAGQRVPSGGR